MCVRVHACGQLCVGLAHQIKGWIGEYWSILLQINGCQRCTTIRTTRSYEMNRIGKEEDIYLLSQALYTLRQCNHVFMSQKLLNLRNAFYFVWTFSTHFIVYIVNNTDESRDTSFWMYKEKGKISLIRQLCTGDVWYSFNNTLNAKYNSQPNSS